MKSREAYEDALKDKKHIHFIGIGGSGMFPIAQILHGQGFYLTGSDNNETDTLMRVRDMGIPVMLGQRAENIEGADLIVHSAAIMEDNPELIAAKASGVRVMQRSELLGLITARYENAVCIAGTHGKTTVTSMLTQIMMNAGLDPSAVIGGRLKAINGNGRMGSTGHMACEACEYADTFLHLYPDIAVVLNIDEDHMEYFKTLDNLINSFHRFCKNAEKAVLINGDDDNSVKAAEGLTQPVYTFGMSKMCDYYPANLTKQDGMHRSFDLMCRGEKIAQICLNIPGEHNILNAVAACAAALLAGTPADKLHDGLAEFQGAGRRFEILGKVNGAVIADDYAHHPAEIEVTLKAARELPFDRIWAIHQPFTYSRTAMLLDDFADVLRIADKVVLSEIMGSREKNTYDIYAKDLCDKIPGGVWFETFDEIVDYVFPKLKEGDLVITLGCGDVYKAAKKLIAKAGH